MTKYAIDIDGGPAIHLQENEPYGEADCGCLLNFDEEGNPQFFPCSLHDHAGALRDALRAIAGTQANGNSEPETMATALENCVGIAQTVLSRLREEKPKSKEDTMKEVILDLSALLSDALECLAPSEAQRAREAISKAERTAQI